MQNPQKSSLQIPSHLLQQIKEGKCIAFVGAGFSMPAGMPTWVQLLEKLLEKEEDLHGDTADVEVRKEIRKLIAQKNGDSLERAAQMLEDLCGPQELHIRLKELLTATKFKCDADTIMYKRCMALLDIPFKAILTTNFDTVIEKCAENGKIPITCSSYFHRETAHDICNKILRSPPKNFGEQLLETSKSVLQLHGSIHDIDDGDDSPLICTRRGYRKMLHENETYHHFLHSVMANYTILYMGFSFSDNYLNDIRGSVLTMLNDKSSKGLEQFPIAYAITDSKSKAEEAFFEHHEGVKFINYNPDVPTVADEDEHDDVLLDPIGSMMNLYDPDTEDPHHGFDDILEDIREQTSPKERFGKILSGKRILWLDKNSRKKDFHAKGFIKLIKSLSKQAVGKANTHDSGSCEIETAISYEHVQSRVLDDKIVFDIIITCYGDNGSDALNVLNTVHRIRTERFPEEMDYASNGDDVEKRVVQCPIVLVHDMEEDAECYKKGKSESKKGQVIRLGALDYTTDLNSLTQSIIRAFSVSEKGRDRDDFEAVPGSGSKPINLKRKVADSSLDEVTENLNAKQFSEQKYTLYILL
jgi:hypothetical protein